MCTLTHIPTREGIYIASNRDENLARKSAHAPEITALKSGTALFPRDAEASGTWVALHARGHALVLLNSAFLAHWHKPPYRRSRGLVLLDMVDSSDPFHAFQGMDLSGIEPFTVVIRTGSLLHDCRWDGVLKHMSALDPLKAHTWSSCTLYDEAIRKKREQWFHEFLDSKPSPSLHDIFDHHTHAGDGDQRNDLVMKRDDVLATVSITGIHMAKGSGIMQYLDLRTGNSTVRMIPLGQTIEIP